MSDTVTAFAPASIGNVAVGFDMLGLALEGVGDRVVARRTDGEGVSIAEVRGLDGEPHPYLSTKRDENTASIAAQALWTTQDGDGGIELTVLKGIPLQSGMGSSAASAVAAVVAVNALLETPLPVEQLLPFAIEGEKYASKGLHADNVAPSLLGGLVLCPGVLLPDVLRLPVPSGLNAVLLHPDMQVDTALARRKLAKNIPVSAWIEQQGLLAGFVAACFNDNVELVAKTLKDVIIESQRAVNVSCFADVREAAIRSGALGCSLSGSGPSIFALVKEGDAANTASAMQQACRAQGIACDARGSAGWTRRAHDSRSNLKYFSTRGTGPVSLDDALRAGIAADGGLFLPESLPRFQVENFAAADTIVDVAETLLAPFFVGSSLDDHLRVILTETFSFPIETRLLPLDGDVSLLELFHGPTSAFKDVGAGFLAACLSRLDGDTDSPLTILVATSGDTGGAVAAAFDQRPGIKVVVLFPDGRVSDRQAHQLSCWSDNVLSLRVQGSFDDCQAMVKAAMSDPGLSARHRFSSANSINIGRLLPQSIYYADTALRHFQRTGNAPGFIIPTGNLGNAFACVLAREMGLPIGPIVLATNANRTIADYFASSRWEPRASLATLASAMDVGDPSNMERMRKLLGEANSLREQLVVNSVTDDAIEASIVEDFHCFGFATCPHTATATHTWRQLDDSMRNSNDWVLVATAHPAKFETIVEPLIGTSVPLPPVLANILERPENAVSIDSSMPSLAAALQAH